MLGSVRIEAHKLKALGKATFDAHWETGKHTPLFHLVNQYVENYNRFGSLDLLNSSSFD